LLSQNSKGKKRKEAELFYLPLFKFLSMVFVEFLKKKHFPLCQGSWTVLPPSFQDSLYGICGILKKETFSLMSRKLDYFVSPISSC
jgi:hypothetical protein